MTTIDATPGAASEAHAGTALSAELSTGGSAIGRPKLRRSCACSTSAAASTTPLWSTVSPSLGAHPARQPRRRGLDGSRACRRRVHATDVGAATAASAFLLIESSWVNDE